ncbi:uncharacterized protein TNCT_666641 [Trichonephila clavata]|uniref:Uncharacterized protein n=1 Tax=Trichonephila clavata TaxID=2740835 RepID=A0A8X6J777_TRICU|nr:uncharacterized protein TNCT_666641 [Trichonephila clavata]
MDLEGDAELESLRLAALATLKSRASKKEIEPSQVDNISKVSTVITSKAFDQSTYGKKDNTDKKVIGSTHNNQNSWRNSSQARGRGRGKQFPKVNQRSNLIVITPVSLNEKKPCVKEPTPQLMLPQHKWCQSVNEDSSSPKSFRKTGPMRFNRHRSRSDSSDSDSDYENSDNDSYSNETILQDEPSEKFNRRTPENNTEEDSVEEPRRITDRRLSFQNINSSLTLDNSTQREPEESFSPSKNTYLNCASVNRKTSRTMPRESESEPKSYTSYNQSTVSSDDSKRQVREISPVQSERSQNTSNINGRSHSKKSYLPGNVSLEKDNRYSRKCSEKPLENNFYKDSTGRSVKNRIDNLSEGDLRFEIKKRMQKSKSENIYSSQSQYESFDHHSCEQTQDNSDRKHLQNSENSEIHNFAHKTSSRENKNHSQRNRSRSSSQNNRTRSTSPIKNRFDQNRQTHSKTDHYYKRDRSSNSSERSYKRNRNQSPDRKNATQNLSRARKCSGSSSSSTSSSSYSSSSSSSTRRQIHSVPSVVKPVSKIVDLKSRGSVNVTEKHVSSAELDSVIGSKRGRDADEKWKIASSAIKSSSYDPEKRNVDGNKRVPVHMRLGTLPCKRLIKVAKDVEAIFVNTSSDDETDVNMRCKKQNYRVVTEMCGNKLDEVSKRHVEKSTYRNVDVMRDRSRRVKIER